MSITRTPHLTWLSRVDSRAPVLSCWLLLTDWILSVPRMSLIHSCLLSDTDCTQEPGPGVQPPVPPPLQLLPV